MANDDKQCGCGRVHSGARYTERGIVYESVSKEELALHFEGMNSTERQKQMASDRTDRRREEILAEMKDLGLRVEYLYGGRYFINSHQSPACHTYVNGIVALEQWLNGFKFRMSIDGYQGGSWR